MIELVTLMLAQAGMRTVAQWAVYAVAIGAIVALAFIGFKAYGVTPPAWFIHALLVVLIAAVIIVLILFVARLPQMV